MKTYEIYENCGEMKPHNPILVPCVASNKALLAQVLLV